MRGQITRLGKNRYRIRFSLPRDPVTGKRARPTKTIHGTRKDAERVLRGWIRDYEFGDWVPGKKVTLNEHLDEWLEITKGDIKERTWVMYSYDLERFARDTIGRMPIDKIRPMVVQNLLVKLVAQGYGPSSVNRLRAPLSKAFAQALLWNRVTSNPVVGTKVPGKDKIKRRPLKAMTPAHANQFLDAASLTPFLTVFEVALSTGMRPGEYQGLAWTSIDWNGRITVEQSVNRPRYKTPYIGQAKTKGSHRSIPVPPKVMESLRDHREAQEAHANKLGPRWNNEHNLVFPNERGEIWGEQKFKTQAFDLVQRRAKLRGYKPYSLRHTCATLLLLGGINPKVVSERLGHASVQRTLDIYSHVLPTMQEQASDKLGEMLFSAYISTIGDQVGIESLLPDNETP